MFFKKCIVSNVVLYSKGLVLMSNLSILLVDDELEILDLLEILLESELSVKLIRSTSGNDAIKKLEEDDSIKLIISDYTMANGTGGDLFNFNKTKNNLPFILLSGGFLNDYDDIKDFQIINEQNVYIQKPVNIEKLISSVKTIFQGFIKNNDDEKNNENLKYKKININHAIYFLKNNKDIYLNIGVNKFIKIINEGELHSTEEFIKYRERGEKYLYVLNKDFDFYMKEILKNIEIRTNKSNSFADTITIGVEGFDFVHPSLKDMGLTDDHVQFVNTVVNKCVTNLMKNSKVSMLLSSFFKEKGYLVSHSLTSIYVTYLICGYLDYSNEKVIEKLVYAGILHDLGLIDKELSCVLSCDDEKFNSLSQKEQKQVLNHTFESIKLLESFSFIPNDVENIILEHHENASSSGFPRGLSSSRISSLSAIFILSLKFSDFLFYRDFKRDAEEFINQLNIEYDKGIFKKPLAGLTLSVKKALSK